MNSKDFLDKVTSEHESCILTICGSMRNRELMEKYCAYYTIKNNVIFTPINYKSITDRVNTFESSIDHHKQFMIKSHYKKIELSDAIIIVVGNDNWVGEDTEREIDYAIKLGKHVLSTSTFIEKYTGIFDFNNDLNFPLYEIKERRG